MTDPRFPDRSKASWLHLSRLNGELFDHIERHPEWLRRSSFADMDGWYRQLASSRWQAWPVFVDADRMRELESAVIGLGRLVRAVPERLFDLDPRRLADFYDLPEPRVRRLVETLGDPAADRLGDLLARGDFLYTRDGWSCIELNMTSDLGGWEPSFFSGIYRRNPLVSAFLDRQHQRIASPNTVYALFQHLVSRALRRFEAGSELHLAFVAPREARAPEPFRRYAEAIYRTVLDERAPGSMGNVAACELAELEIRDRRVYHRGRRLRVLIELYGGELPAPLVEAWRAGEVDLYNGPPTPLFRDKRNLALLSEHADSDRFTAEERRSIARHLPWTRRMELAETDYCGDRVTLGDFVVAHRERLVLKPGRGSGGRDVHLGDATPPARWRELVRRASHEGRWVVQERIDPVPQLCRSGEEGSAVCDSVWGTFVFGDRCGGGFVRVLPRGDERRPVNAATGAEDVLVFEVGGPADREPPVDSAILFEDGAPPPREAPVAAPDAEPDEVQPAAPAAFEARAHEIHDQLAELNRRFLEAAEADPRYLRRSSFSVLDREVALRQYRLQSWPTFLDPATRDEIQRVNSGITELIKSVPERFFDNDPERIEEFYGYPPEMAQLVTLALEQRSHLRGLFSRGDFIRDPTGFQCLEINLVSNVGGWGTAVWADLYRQVPLLDEFLDAAGVEAVYTDTAEVCFRHLIARARDCGVVTGGEVNVAFAVPESNQAPPSFRRFATAQLGAAARAEGCGPGHVDVCSFDQLRERGERLYLGERRIHLLIEHYGGLVPRHVLFPWLAGNLVLYNGPASHLLDDRRNLALLSQYGESEYFEAEERRLIRDHVPWTRFLEPGYADYRDERVLLPDFILDQRQRMVLKHVASGRGEKIVLGVTATADGWRQAVEAGLAEGSWIVQEKVTSLPYLFQRGPVGWAEHDVVWGFFLFGDLYGGGFLRMMPCTRQGVINAARGAEEGILFEVDG